jgi:5-methylcytosine-specific restriction protein A
MQTQLFKQEINRRMRLAASIGAPYVDITSGDVHRAVGGYPGTNHRMPMCCDAMYHARQAGDVVLHAPPKGKGASLTIRYSTNRNHH